jgi:hypothetical protein
MLAQIAALRAEVEDPTCALRAELADELDRGTVEYRRSTCGQELGLSVPRMSTHQSDENWFVFVSIGIVL